MIPDLKGINLRDYQVDAYNAVAENVRKYEGPCYEELSVGAGKTYLIAAIAKRFSELERRVLVLTSSEDLVSQNSDAAWEVGLMNSVWCAGLGRKSKVHKVIFGSVKSILNSIDSQLSDVSFSCLLIDECDTVPYDRNDSEYMKVIAELMRRNPRMMIFGFTGSPFRGCASITGDFWKKVIYRKSMEDLTGEGFLVPSVYGDHADGYDYSEFKPIGGDGAQDFTQAEMAAMQRLAHKQITRTQKIMLEVVNLSKNRNGVMITCAGRKHCEEAAEFLPKGEWCIIDSSIGSKERHRLVGEVKAGRIKYVLQVGCLTVGFNAPLLDVNVILRPIGSLRLLIQLIGRTARLLKDEHISAGYVKNDMLILDYAGTFESLGELYFNPMLEQAELARATKTGELITCPECGTMNSSHARRCIGRDASSRDGRCSFFWISRDCPHCGEKNDIAARYCRSCDGILIDPNAKLTGKAYSADDWKPVTKMEIEPCKNGGIVVKYHTDSELDDGRPEIASMYFNPWSGNATAKRIYESQFVNRHINDWGWRKKFSALPNAQAVMKMRAMLDVPTHITHRLNDDGKSIVHGMKFATREIAGSKHKSVA